MPLPLTLVSGSIQAEAQFAGQILRGEGFVHFDELNILEAHPRFFQGFLRGGHRSVAHEMRFNAGNGMRDNPRHRRQAQVLGRCRAS